MTWYYKDAEITELPECVGFVYKITNIYHFPSFKVYPLIIR